MLQSDFSFGTIRVAEGQSTISPSLPVRYRPHCDVIISSDSHPSRHHPRSGLSPTTPTPTYAMPTSPPRRAEARPAESRRGRWRPPSGGWLRTASPSASPTTHAAPGSRSTTPSPPRGRLRCHYPFRPYPPEHCSPWDVSYSR